MIFFIVGKGGSGKDTILSMIHKKTNLKKIVYYTTRPMRHSEVDGREYYFVDEETYHKMKRDNKVLESREYHTVHGTWYYFTAYDEQLENGDNYVVAGPLQMYLNYLEKIPDSVVPIYITLTDETRRQRMMGREQAQEKPNYDEMERRMKADDKDFAEADNLFHECQISNDGNLEDTVEKVIRYINSKLSDAV